MPTLDYSIHLMPAAIQTVARLSTPHLAVRFAREFGGQDVYFPEKLHADHRLVLILGDHAATLVCREWLRETIVVPRASAYLRWFDARCLEVLGLSRIEISRRLGLTYTHTLRLLRGFDPSGIQINATVKEVARVYRLNARQAKRMGRERTPVSSAQMDFGWKHMAGRAGIRVSWTIAPRHPLP